MKPVIPLLPHLLVNVLVVVVAIVALIATSNPLSVLVLYFLQQMPVFQPDYGEPEEEEEEGSPIGFVQ